MIVRRPHRGMTLVEIGVSLVVLGAALAALLQLVALAGQQRRSLAQRRLALQEVSNQAERIALLPWAETAPAHLTAWQPSADLTAVLPAAKCSIAASDEPGSPASRRILLEVAWTNVAGQPVEPVTLTVWRLAPEATP
jgi:Tfp pilus assembly protein PilV